MASKVAKGNSHYKPSETEIDKYVINQKESGIITVNPSGLKVIWGKDPRCWKLNDGSFELIQVAWLEVSGGIKMSYLPTGNYSLSFNVKVNDEAFGFENCPVYVMAKLPGGKHIWQKVDIRTLENNKNTDIPGGDGRTNELTFIVKETYNSDDLFTFGLYDIWSNTWKGGLVINHVRIAKKPA